MVKDLHQYQSLAPTSGVTSHNPQHPVTSRNRASTEMQKYSGMPTSYMLDDSGPRPPPRFIRPPVIAYEEKPVPLVPDVSLIMNSPSTNARYNKGGGSTIPAVTLPMTPPIPTPPPSIFTTMSPETGSGVSNKLIYELMGMIKKQSSIIERMDLQLQALVAASSKPSNSNEQKCIDREVQTEREQGHPSTSAKSTSTTPTPVANTQEKDQVQKKKKKKVKRGSDSSSSSSASRKSNSPQSQSSTKDTSCPCSDSKKDEVPANENKKIEAVYKPSADESIRENSQDLSTILRELQLPTIQEQSIYSADNSIRHIDFNSMNSSKNGSPGLETSASLYCTSSEDEDENSENVVQPTATFYRNVIGNVNRLLENNKDTSPPAIPRHRHRNPRQDPPPTDTTIYGMTSNNLSFATRQYLQRHGLVNSGNDCDGGEPRQAPQRFLPNPCNPYHPQYPADRILDLTTLKNQPKLM